MWGLEIEGSHTALVRCAGGLPVLVSYRVFISNAVLYEPNEQGENLVCSTGFIRYLNKNHSLLIMKGIKKDATIYATG